MEKLAIALSRRVENLSNARSGLQERADVGKK